LLANSRERSYSAETDNHIFFALQPRSNILRQWLEEEEEEEEEEEGHERQ
jgi:hypothetical protein